MGELPDLTGGDPRIEPAARQRALRWVTDALALAPSGVTQLLTGAHNFDTASEDWIAEHSVPRRTAREPASSRAATVADDLIATLRKRSRDNNQTTTSTAQTSSSAMHKRDYAS